MLPREFHEALETGLRALGIEVDEAGRALLGRYVERLLHWNRKVNLTAVTDPAAVAEVHLVDSLALLRTMGRCRTVLDIGSGAGLPGAVLACVRPELAVTCCDVVAKKVAFLKSVSAELGLAVEGRAVRAAGEPEAEGLARCDVVVSRAVADAARWIPLGRRYLAPEGRLFAMLGRGSDRKHLEALAAGEGLRLEVLDEFVLPGSGAERAIARFGVG